MRIKNRAAHHVVLRIYNPQLVVCLPKSELHLFFSSRSQEKLISEIGFFSNPVFSVAVGCSVLGQLAVIYLPPLQVK